MSCEISSVKWSWQPLCQLSLSWSKPSSFENIVLFLCVLDIFCCLIHYFYSFVLLILTKYSFQEEKGALAYNSKQFWDLLEVSTFPKILGTKAFRIQYVFFLFWIITLWFTCGRRKIWKNIMKFQNIMTRVVGFRYENHGP